MVSRAAAYNQPLSLWSTRLPAGSQASFFATDHAAAVIDTVKKAEDSDDLILRIYESRGTRVNCSLGSCLSIKAAALTNMLEDRLASLPVRANRVALSLRPFQVLTLRLKLSRA